MFGALMASGELRTWHPRPWCGDMIGPWDAWRSGWELARSQGLPRADEREGNPLARRRFSSGVRSERIGSLPPPPFPLLPFYHASPCDLKQVRNPPHMVKGTIE